VGTLIFFVMTKGQVPSYLGSSFAFIGVVIAASGYAGPGPNANIGVALGGIIACGVVYTIIGMVVQAIGTGWIERFMPPVVTGSVVAVIGLNLAGIPIKNMAPTHFDAWMQAITFVSVALVAVFTKGMLQRLLILLGLIVASVIFLFSVAVVMFVSLFVSSSFRPSPSSPRVRGPVESDPTSPWRSCPRIQGRGKFRCRSQRNRVPHSPRASRTSCPGWLAVRPA
jgi:xanthine/uracil permease